MENLNGNTLGYLQKKISTKNKYGEGVLEWETIAQLKGYLDLASGSARYTTYNAKLTDSTHIFISEYKPLACNEESVRMVINNQEYDVTYIDNPMELNYHLEIYLKFVGGQNG